MTKQIRWLNREISAWQSEQLISDQQATQIRARYAVGENPSGWDKLIFPVMGAVVFGLGIILFFAYNWADLHKYQKLAVVFGSLLTVHGLGYYINRSVPAKKGLAEGMHVLGTMLFGAGIWLIAQIYHLDEHYPTGLLAWGLGALLFAWVLPSVAQGLIAVVLFSLWSGVEIVDFRQTFHTSWLTILVGLVPLAWMMRSRALLFFSLLAFSILFIYNIAENRSSILNYLPFFLACLYMALANLVIPSRFPESASVLHFIGFATYMFCLYLFSFEFHGGYFSRHSSYQWGSLAYYFTPITVSSIAWLTVFTQTWLHLSKLQRWEAYLIWSAMSLVTAASLIPIQSNVFGFSLLLNSIYLGHCIVLIKQGIQKVSWKRVSLGCILMAALLVVRFADLFGSLLIRALLFVLLGIGLFTVGHFYTQQKQRETADA